MHAKPDFPVHPLRISVSPTDLHVCFVGGWWNLVVGLKDGGPCWLHSFLGPAAQSQWPVALSPQGKIHPPTTEYAHAQASLAISSCSSLPYSDTEIHTVPSHTHTQERYIRKHKYTHATRMHILCPRDGSIYAKRSTFPVRLAIFPKLGGKTWLLILPPPSSLSLSPLINPVCPPLARNTKGRERRGKRPNG